MKLFKKAICVILALTFTFALTACVRNFEGEWKNEDSGVIFELNGSGSFVLRLYNYCVHGTYLVDNDTVTFDLDIPVMQFSESVVFRIEGDKLVLDGYEGPGELCLTRVTADAAVHEGLPAPGEIDIAEYTYKNDSFGFGFELDRTWDIGLTDDFRSALGTMDYYEALKSLDVIEDFCAENITDGRAVNVRYDNMKNHMAVAYEEEAYLKIASTGIRMSIESKGGTMKTIESVTRTFGGKEFSGHYFVADYDGRKTHGYAFVSKFGDYMGVITIYALSVEELDATLGLFYPLS